MALFCSCGAELPDQADQPREEPQPAAAPQAFTAIPPVINFGNPIAVRVALLCASISGLLNLIPFVSFGCCLWVLGAGFFSVFLYGRRTGLLLSVRDGARLGWITGLFTFVIGIVFTSLAFVATRSGGGLRDALRQVMEKMPAQDAAARQMMEFMASPAGLAFFLLIYIVMAFLVVVSLAIAGGALGAKVMEKE
ncbi:MAG: hypothetical protein HY236_03960 [Acidobacteria bacterium]|nr:hypothetical protein [Acidobacteriota bacterium]